MPSFKCCFAVQQMLPSTVRTVSSEDFFLVLIDSPFSGKCICLGRYCSGLWYPCELNISELAYKYLQT